MCLDGRQVSSPFLHNKNIGVIWNSSLSCNQLCSYCPIDYNLKCSKEKYTDKSINNIKDFFINRLKKTAKYLLIHGHGEPLLEIDTIYDIITYLKIYNVLPQNTVMYTNGLLLLDDNVYSKCIDMPYIKYVLHFVGIHNEFARTHISNNLSIKDKEYLVKRFNSLHNKVLKVPILEENMFILSSIVEEITDIVISDTIEFAIDDRKSIPLGELNIDSFISELVKVAEILHRKNIRPTMVFNCGNYYKVDIIYPGIINIDDNYNICSYERSQKYSESIIKTRQYLIREYRSKYCINCSLKNNCGPCLLHLDKTSLWDYNEDGSKILKSLGSFNKCLMFTTIDNVFKKVLGSGLFPVGE